MFRKILFPIIASLVIALPIILSGCSPAAPTSTIKGPATVVATPTNKTTQPAASTASPVISSLKSPTVLPLKLKAGLSANGLVVNIEALIHNPNSEPVTIDEIKLSTVNAEGYNRTQDTFPGGIIEASASKVFTFDIELAKKVLTDRTLSLQLETQTKNTPTIFLLKTTAPIDIAGTVEKLIIHPNINLQATINKISYYPGQAMVEAQLEGSISNPNPIELSFTSLLLSVNKKDDVPIRDMPIQAANIAGNVIPAKADFPFKSTLLLPLETLNQTTLKAYAYTSIQFLNNVQKIETTKVLAVPKFSSLITTPQIIFSVKSGWNENAANRMYAVNVIADLKNDNDFALTTSDFKLSVYNNASGVLVESATVPALSNGIAKSSTHSVINYGFSLTEKEVGRLGFEAAIVGDITVGMQGVNEKIPIKTKILYNISP